MRLSCPCCGQQFPLEAGFAEADGKRLAALFAQCDPKLGRALLDYLRLFSAPSRNLRLPKAIVVVEELLALVESGSVQRDARTPDNRVATVRHWMMGMEHMLFSRERLTLPLENHRYLRAVVWGLAGEPLPAEPLPPVRSTAPSALPSYQEAHSKITGDLMLGLIDQAEAERRRQALAAR